MPLLSIGMIVKNEESTLRQTLMALQTLRDAISCQLIIADTGSTDGTLQIAEEFADIVFSIPWEDDFAKARNATLKKATGQWFFYLDADEKLEDSEELIEFLKSSRSRKFNAIRLMIRSITSSRNCLLYTSRCV